MRLSGDRGTDIELLMLNYRLTTAEILYGLPDHPHLLQSFTWQLLDLPPSFPRLHDFLDFWSQQIDAPLHSIRVMHAELIRPANFRYVDKRLKLN